MKIGKQNDTVINFLENSTSCETDSSSASQEIAALHFIEPERSFRHSQNSNTDAFHMPYPSVLLNGTKHEAPQYATSAIILFLSPFTSKYYPERPVFDPFQHMFLAQCDRPSFTPIRNSRQSYRCVFIDNK
jgi:hypothetical protein